MLFKFKSRACADLIMLEADARRVLKAMTGDDPVKGIVRVADLPAVLARLEAAVAEDEALLRQSVTGQSPPSDRSQGAAAGAEEAQLPAIRLAQRAIPMLQMIRRCMREEADLVWGV